MNRLPLRMDSVAAARATSCGLRSGSTYTPQVKCKVRVTAAIAAKIAVWSGYSSSGCIGGRPLSEYG